MIELKILCNLNFSHRTSNIRTAAMSVTTVLNKIYYSKFVSRSMLHFRTSFQVSLFDVSLAIVNKVKAKEHFSYVRHMLLELSPAEKGYKSLQPSSAFLTGGLPIVYPLVE
jgi:hypothetical protein